MKTTQKAVVILISIFGVFNLKIDAQVPHWSWAQSGGAAGYEDEATSVAVDASGNSFVVGYFNAPSITFGSVSINNAGSDNIFIVKYDPSGNVAWVKCADGNTSAYTYSVAVDPSGNVYVTGYFFSSTITFDTITLNNSGGSADMFVVKFDTNGNAIWARKAGGTGFDEGSAVASDGLGNIYVSGDFSSGTITFGAVTLVNSGGSDMFLVKYDPNGNALWATGSSGSADEWTWSVTTDIYGNVFVAGEFESPVVDLGSFSLSNNGGIDMFLAKFNATNGNVIWAKAAGGIDDDVSHGVTTDTHGNIFLVGDYFSPSIVFGSNTLTNSNGGNTDDAFIAKYDSLGNDVWAKSAGGSNYDIAFSVSSNGYDSIFVAGFFYSDTITFNASTIASNKGLFVIKLDDNGNLVWIKDAVGLGAAVSVVAVASGSVYVTGDFFEPAITFDATILNNSSSDSSADVFIAKLDMVTGLSNVSVAPGFLSIYPNPFNDEFVINGTTQKGKIIILDAMNKEVLSQKTINGETKINTCNLKPGFYILRYIKDGRVINSKLIKN